MGNPFDQFDTPIANTAQVPASLGNPFDQFDAPQAQQGPLDSASFKAQLHAILAAPDFTPDKAKAFIEANHRTATGSTNDALAWAQQHPGHGGEVGIQDFGPQPAPAGQPAQPQQPTQVQAQAPEGYLGTAVRSVANGLTAGLADKAAAGMESVIPGIGNPGTETVWQGHGLGDAYAHNKAVELGQTAATEAGHPIESLVGNVAGAVASPLGKIGAGMDVAEGAPMVARVAAKYAPGAIYGGIYGAGQSDAPTWGGEAMDAAKGAAGAVAGQFVGGKLARGVGAAVSGMADPVKRALYQAGTRFTPGQLMGGAGQAFEDKLSSLPFTGAQINSRLAESGQGWNTATLNRALEPYGAQIPKGVTGSDAFAYGQRAVDKAFADARSGLQVAKTPEFEQTLSQLQDRVENGGTEALPPDLQKRFANVVQNNVLRKFNADGIMSANDYTKAASDLRTAARKQMAGNNPADAQEYGRALNDLADGLDHAALSNPASDPAAVAQLQKARDGYRLWALAQGAADRGGSGTAGQFTPTQYLQEVEKGDQTVRNNAFTQGKAFDQAYGQNSLAALGQRVPNSFTPDRLLATKLMTEGLPAAAAGFFHAPGAVQSAALIPLGIDALGAAAYSRPINAFTNKLALGSRPAAVAQIGQKLNAFAPQAGRIGTGVGGTLAVQHATP